MEGQFATRLSCFAVIAAVESDLRDLVRADCDPSRKDELLPPDVRDQARQRFDRDLRSPYGAAVLPDSELDLLPYVDFADLSKTLRRMGEAPVDGGAVGRFEVATRLEKLAPARNRVCHSRPLEAGDHPTLLDFARWVAEACPSTARSTRVVLHDLQANPHFVLGLRIPEFWTAGVETIKNNLPLPEFDDTGFLGRQKDRRAVAALLVGPHPVISIVGAGGVGKTSLLLRCLYDLLDEGRKQWDAIVWVSLKTRTLTAKGITELEDAVASTVGLLQAVEKILGAPGGQDRGLDARLESVREYLQELRILLAIDNFETVEDAREALYPLLTAVPVGSKVVLTSRRGLGELELRYTLETMEEGTAAALLRRSAQALNVRVLAEASDGQIRKFVTRLLCSPLLIRWFVSSVSFGSDPEVLLDRKEGPFTEVMKFCVENLFAGLSNEERLILHTMAAARRRLTQTELQFILGELRREKLAWSLGRLQQASVVERHARGGRDALEAVFEYSLSEIASEYVTRQDPPNAKTFGRVQEFLKELAAIAYKRPPAQGGYDLNTVIARSRDERIAAAQLRRALEAYGLGDYVLSRQFVEHARELAPRYSEVYRVAGMVAARQSDHFRAVTDFETAVDLEPKSTLAWYAFTRFLIDDLGDYERALSCIETALELDATASALLSAKATTLVRMSRFGEGVELHEALLRKASAEDDPRFFTAAADHAAESYRAWAAEVCGASDVSQARRHLGRSLQILEQGLQQQPGETQLLRRLATVMEDGMKLAVEQPNAAFSVTLLECLARQWESLRFYDLPHLRQFGAVATPGVDKGFLALGTVRSVRGIPAGQSQRFEGTVSHLKETYGFIRSADGQRWFFHKAMLRDSASWPAVTVGRRATFVTGRNDRGPCATDVLVDDLPGREGDLPGAGS